MKELINKITKWVGTDGLLHFLVCYAMMLTLTPCIGLWWAMLATIIVAFSKEAWDYFKEKDNNKEQVLHDLICNGVGIVTAIIVWFIY
jgi:hypothetical protein